MACSSIVVICMFNAICLLLSFVFFIDPVTTKIYTLSLHDALPIFLAMIALVAVVVATVILVFFGIGTTTDRKSTRLNSSHRCISYAVFCLKKKIFSYAWR